ncbi:MGMT family protein [Bdellovibrio sp. BCCA]|uniref:MGMT family protein n=1 Tax=Bdellovibrio sp. BCCA TaxID=3136281 RepID=UPI0030F1DCC5
MEQTDFSKKVISFIKKIPKGKVATYGQIAKLAGKPQGSRGVAWILHSCSESHDLPWQRVLNSKGKISFPPSTSSYVKQKRLLVKEGIEFGEQDQIDLKKFQWRKKVEAKKTNTRSPKMFS